MTKKQINKRIARLLNKDGVAKQRLLRSHEKALEKVYRDLLAKVKKDIANLIEKAGDNLTIQEANRYNRLQKLEAQIKNDILQVKNKVSTEINNALKEQYLKTYEGTTKAYADGLEGVISFNKIDKNVVNVAMLNSIDRIKWDDRLKLHAQDYIIKIRNEIAQGIRLGEGYSKIARRLSKQTSINFNKIQRIVRTEAHRVQNVSKLLSVEKIEEKARKNGLKMERVWVATKDMRTRDSHIYMDGQVATEEDGQSFFVFQSGATTDVPGNSGIAEEDINCRCTWISQLATEEEK